MSAEFCKKEGDITFEWFGSGDGLHADVKLSRACRLDDGGEIFEAFCRVSERSVDKVDAIGTQKPGKARKVGAGVELGLEVRLNGIELAGNNVTDD